jgi:pimeloyl-ACP methyl ester carboxylesterase
VPYDWRSSVADSATVLENAVSEKLNGEKREVRFIAHGMGGLVVQEFARRDEARWKALCGESGGLLMLGTPTGGSWHVTRLLAGRSRLVRMIALLGRHRDSDVVPILQSFRGLLDLLPEEMLDLAAWHDVQLGRPAAEKLQTSAAWRNEIEDFRPAFGRNPLHSRDGAGDAFRHGRLHGGGRRADHLRARHAAECQGLVHCGRPWRVDFPDDAHRPAFEHRH